ncbi:uncharacterized protein DNG_05492 [Cephalotrichum gorgonifer]|uniref:Uncharacterized protein n=1 Tax=Cephalotrichum gorgonifer TaxID=2041049 RepID=A0AAE8N100_9PEZI|nr:uncharacterized protein DNG_05492 [Cephalotrichum gorgonifer]
MPIREKVRRALRRSGPPSPSPTHSLSTSTSASTSASSPEVKLSSRLANFSFGSPRSSRGRFSGSKASGASSRGSGGSEKRVESPDPREKPLTEANLRYQRVFGEYTMTFGASRRLSRDWETEGISPMTSRRNSLCLE